MEAGVRRSLVAVPKHHSLSPRQPVGPRIRASGRGSGALERDDAELLLCCGCWETAILSLCSMFYIYLSTAP
ncbi:hypothetical protein P154DRAFT_245430 [Amniculicola lignicola CBS 123094]|uniref:Uncharacterized protein n=1 Tax=Amniculicola lignicola CBS 123094 TaxID=1392246 RepID=A0A6A5WB01_9PLEO|nr:hypothetical protein P154DRAFT_245430 [Amniculicola lignicola CBS 123094]